MLCPFGVSSPVDTIRQRGGRGGRSDKSAPIRFLLAWCERMRAAIQKATDLRDNAYCAGKVFLKGESYWQRRQEADTIFAEMQAALSLDDKEEH